MAGVGELNGPGPSYIVADTDAAFAEDTIVIITNPEGAVLSDGQLWGNICRQLVKPDMVDGSLQLAIITLEAGFVWGGIPSFKVSIGVSRKHELQAVIAQFLEPQFVGMDNHPFGYRGDTSQLRLGNAFHLNDTEAAGSIGL